tara:strand:+ start:1293 stop:1445 length:153 start_codon:yes stop_codon:yes gene_type:complete
MINNKSMYSVWVGGTEVNDCYFEDQLAFELAELYISMGYDDVAIEEIKND